MKIGLIAYLTGFIAYFTLGLFALAKRQPLSLVFAVILTAFWLACIALQQAYGLFPMQFIWIGEVIYLSSWLICCARFQNFSVKTILWIALFQIAYIGFSPFIELSWPDIFSPSLALLGHLGLAVIGLILIERYYRNALDEQRWRIKFFCLALGALFIYEFYFYAEALLFSSIRADLWQARGFFLALLTPLFAVYFMRNGADANKIAVSRQLFFHSTALLGCGIYLLSMAICGYYIKFFGGEWGSVIRVVFMAFAFLLLALLLFSKQIRAHGKVLLSKHFFKHFYDYRQEWLRLMATLSTEDSRLSLKERVIVALAQLVESQSGVLWLRESNGLYIQSAFYGNPGIQNIEINTREPLASFIEKNNWILNLQEKTEGLPDWLTQHQSAWLLMPLMKDGQALGLVLLTKPTAPIIWNWEVRDLLKSASRLAASHLALEEAGIALSQARQFEGFNRLSAFVMHDLKNVITQLSLMLRNAEKHKQNPEFMKDFIETVDHSVNKMSSLMSQLRNSNPAASSEILDLMCILTEVVEARKKQNPQPLLEPVKKALMIQANRDRLASSIEHVIHNAQDAAGKFGKVSVKTRTDGKRMVFIEVEDDGLGMDESFIQKRLFKPFDTTKGLTGMGIGAYESREYVRSLGGELSVQSEPGKGSLFCFAIPLDGDAS